MPRLLSVDPEDDIDDVPALIPQTQTKIDDEAGEQLEQELVTTTEQKQAKERKAASEPNVEKVKESAPELDESVNGDTKDENEFEVEKIVGHVFKGKRCLYQVRWRGWSEGDDTFEPEEHLLPDAKELLAAYHTTNGGAPQPAKRVAKSASKANMREEAGTKTATEDEDTPASTHPAKRARRGHKSGEDVDWNSVPVSDWHPANKGSWEDLVEGVETVERNENGTLQAFIRFRNGKRSKVAQNLYHSRCPRAMLRFYESHLNLSSA